MLEGIPVPAVNITKLFDIVLNDPAQSKLPLNDPLRLVTVVPYNRSNTESTRWKLLSSRICTK